VLRGDSRTLHHHYDHVTIYLTRWTLITAALLIVTSSGLALVNMFPGQKSLRPTTLAVGRVRIFTEDEKKDLGEGGIVAEVPVNACIWGRSLPKNLRLQISLAKSLAEKCSLTAEFRLWSRSSAEEKWQVAQSGVSLIETERPDFQRIELPMLKPSEHYSLCIYLATKCKNVDLAIAQKLINREHKITIIGDAVR